MDSSTNARQRSIQARAALLASSQDAESRRAQTMIDAFVAEAAVSGPPPVPLRAQTLGRRPIRTNLRGWYLRNDHSAAVGVDGLYYFLRLPTDWLAVLRGARPNPSPAPLVLGRGGRDGEAIDLADALKRALAGQIP